MAINIYTLSRSLIWIPGLEAVLDAIVLKTLRCRGKKEKARMRRLMAVTAISTSVFCHQSMFDLVIIQAYMQAANWCHGRAFRLKHHGNKRILMRERQHEFDRDALQSCGYKPHAMSLL